VQNGGKTQCKTDRSTLNRGGKGRGNNVGGKYEIRRVETGPSRARGLTCSRGRTSSRKEFVRGRERNRGEGLVLSQSDCFKGGLNAHAYNPGLCQRSGTEGGYGITKRKKQGQSWVEKLRGVCATGVKQQRRCQKGEGNHVEIQRDGGRAKLSTYRRGEQGSFPKHHESDRGGRGIRCIN